MAFGFLMARLNLNYYTHHPQHQKNHLGGTRFNSIKVHVVGLTTMLTMSHVSGRTGSELIWKTKTEEEDVRKYNNHPPVNLGQWSWPTVYLV